MSTTLETSLNHMSLSEQHSMNTHDSIKIEKSLSKNQLHQGQSIQHQQVQQPHQSGTDKQQHPLHQYDLTVMSKFYTACVGKLKEQNPKWEPTEWSKMNPMPSHLSLEQKHEWNNPFVLSHKQHVYESFAKLARESGEPMILLPNFDYGDILNFERFLQALKQDGVNAIGKYKLYLNNKDMRKFEVDLVVIHPRYGVLLVEVKECDHMDNKRRSRAKAQLNNARTCFQSMARLIIEAKGWSHSEAHIQVTDFIALPNVQERPVNTPHPSHMQQHQTLQTPGGNQNQSATSTTSTSGRGSRQLHYLIKSDLENSVEFAKWWTKFVVEPKVQQHQLAEAENKVNKFDSNAINWMVGLINCIRNNSIMPVVYPEADMFEGSLIDEIKPAQPTTNGDADKPTKTDETITTTTTTTTTDGATTTTSPGTTNGEKIKEQIQFQPAMNVHGEFFQAEHEAARSLSKVVVCSKNTEKIRKTICLQTLWFLLNDSQKKISVVCSELNKAYYEEFFSHQRKLYNNLHNLRFYTDLQSCSVEGQHTLRKDGEIWFFDSILNNGNTVAQLNEVIERAKGLNAFWVFTTQEELIGQYNTELEGAKVVRLDTHLNEQYAQNENEITMPWLTGNTLKFPLRIQCDLLIIGDIVGVTQLKSLYRYLKSTVVTINASHCISENQPHQTSHHQQAEQNGRHQNGGRYNHQQQQQSQHNHNQHQREQLQHQQLNFNPSKKFKSVKFIRGGTIENLRNSLKMHDSIQAQVVLMHVGDEDLFKTRNSLTTVERAKELATLVKEYCPKSFTVLSTLMRRMSRTENGVINEVNKGIVSFCKQTRESGNFYYMSNSHFEPDYHTQEGRNLSNKGLRLYIENLLFMVDYFMIKNNKQH